jgi:hypothetical protein
MKRNLFVAVVLFSLSSVSSLIAQGQGEIQSPNPQNHVITVLRNGTVFAKPDVGILAMSIRSSAPIAEEAVAENGRKATNAESALAGLGFAPTGFKLTSVIFGEPGNSFRGLDSGANTVYEATQYIYVFFEGKDLADVAQLTTKSAAVMEALRKAGAVPANLAGPRVAAAPGGMILYTIKDSTQYERQALEIAIGRARDAAQDIAKGLDVHISGLRNVRAAALGGNYLPHSGIPYLEGLPYRFFSTKSNGVEISANATVDYNFK